MKQGDIISHYELLEQIGSGGMGVVYGARDLKLWRKVAIKFLPTHLSADPDARLRLEHEARAASALDHANICTIYEIGEDEEHHIFIVMGFYAGASLDTVIADGPLEIEKAVDLARQIAFGLAAAHRAGIVHRDVKPANIILTDDGVIKVLDFGLAKHSDIELTISGTTLGTIGYMSPEQVRGESVGTASDIWSFGVMMYELLSGQRPFQGDYDYAVQYGILNEDPRPVAEIRPEVPEAYSEIVSRCLRREPGERYETLDELVTDLDERRLPESAHEARPAAEEEPVARQQPRASKRLVAAASIVGLALLAALAALFALRPGASEGIEKRHLAVLPFRTVGGTESEAVLVDGLQENLTSMLTRLEAFQSSFWVVPPDMIREQGITTSSEAARAFGVNLVVGGSLQQRDEGYRMTLNLIDPETSRTLASDIIDQRRGDVAALENDLLIRLLELLDVALAPEATERVMRGRSSVEEAQSKLVRARGFLQRRDLIGNVDSAVALFRQATTLDTAFAQGHAGLGEAYWRQFELTGQTAYADSAIVSSQKAVSSDRLLAPARIALGMVYTGVNEYNEAIVQLQEAIALEPRNPSAYREIAQAYDGKGQLKQAEDAFKKAIELRPEFWGGHNDLGRFYHEHGRHTEASEQYQEVIRLTPDNPSGYTSLAAQLSYLERNDEAIVYYRQSIERRPNRLAYYNLAWEYRRTHQYESASEMLEMAVGLDSLHYKSWELLADSYLGAGTEIEIAHRALRRVVEIGQERLRTTPGDPELLTKVAAAHAGLGQFSSARELVRRIEEVPRLEGPDYVTMARLFEAMGDRAAALDQLRMAFERGGPASLVDAWASLEQLRSDPRYEQLAGASSG